PQPRIRDGMRPRRVSVRRGLEYGHRRWFRRERAAAHPYIRPPAHPRRADQAGCPGRVLTAWSRARGAAVPRLDTQCSVLENDAAAYHSRDHPALKRATNEAGDGPTPPQHGGLER